MKILILDCNNLLHRTFWVAKNQIEDDESGPITVHLFMNSVMTYVTQFKPDKIYAVWDKKLTYPSSNFRKELLPNTYKANRDTSTREETHQYDDKLEALLSSIGVNNIFPNKMEADDVIAWLAHNIHGEITIVTVDKDMLQLINANTQVYSPIKKELITEKNFEFHNKDVPLKYFLTLKALVGDQSDNIDGIPRVGPKKGLKLAKEIVDSGNLDCLSDEHKEIYKRNLSIMDLTKGYLYEDEYKVYANQLEAMTDKRNFNMFTSICKELALNRIINNKDKWYRTFFEANKLSRLVEQLGLH